MAYNGLGTSCHGLYFMNIASPECNMKRGSIPLKRFHGVSNSSGTSIGEHLGLCGHLKKEELSYRHLVSSTRSSNTVVQLANVPEQAKKVVEFDFKKYMLSKALEVNEALDKSIPLTYPKKIYESMRYSLLARGKWVRHVLCIIACELVGGTEELAMPTTCAMEIIHTMSLIHDDFPCMDNDDIHRGKPTNHKVFGEGTAILGGVALHSFSFQHIAVSTRKTVGSDRILRVVTELGKTLGSQGIMGGHIVDIASEQDASLDLDILEWIHIHKTRVLLECSTVCGAIIDGASADEIEKIRRFNHCVGILFRVVDDILDVTKSSEQIGKTTGNDLFTDKATYPRLMGLDKAREFTAELLNIAKEELSFFDPTKASLFLGLADYIALKEN